MEVIVKIGFDLDRFSDEAPRRVSNDVTALTWPMEQGSKGCHGPSHGCKEIMHVPNIDLTFVLVLQSLCETSLVSRKLENSEKSGVGVWRGLGRHFHCKFDLKSGPKAP